MFQMNDVYIYAIYVFLLGYFFINVAKLYLSIGNTIRWSYSVFFFFLVFLPTINVHKHTFLNIHALLSLHSWVTNFTIMHEQVTYVGMCCQVLFTGHHSYNKSLWLLVYDYVSFGKMLHFISIKNVRKPLCAVSFFHVKMCQHVQVMCFFVACYSLT